MMNKSTFNKLLKHYGSQTAIANVAGVSRASVSHWRHNKNGCGAVSAIKLSRDCGIDPGQLCGDLK